MEEPSLACTRSVLRGMVCSHTLAQRSDHHAHQRARWGAGCALVGVEVAVAGVRPRGHDEAAADVGARTWAGAVEAQCQASVAAILFRDRLDPLLHARGVGRHLDVRAGRRTWRRRDRGEVGVRRRHRRPVRNNDVINIARASA